MKRALLLLALMSSAARAQAPAAFGELRFRGGVVDNFSAGAIGDDWKPRVGKEVGLSTPFVVGEVEASIGRIHYRPLTGHPTYTATILTLRWMTPELGRLVRMSGGVGLSDYLMAFDDASLVAGLRTEEEVMPSFSARIRAPLTSGLSLFGEGRYGLLMLGHHTKMGFINVGAQLAMTTPAWLQDFLR
jgi:hypothetical protein